MLTTLTVIYFSFATLDVRHYSTEVEVRECIPKAKTIQKQVRVGRVWTFCGRKQV